MSKAELSERYNIVSPNLAYLSFPYKFHFTIHPPPELRNYFFISFCFFVFFNFLIRASSRDAVDLFLNFRE
jgi:hypothetical protein